MLNQNIVYEASQEKLLVFYSLMLIALIYMLKKYGHKSPFWFFILIFFGGLFAALGKDIQNAYRIVLAFSSFYFLIRYKLFKVGKVALIHISFFIFSLLYFITSLINEDYFQIIFSQYSRYFIIYVVFLLFYKYHRDPNFKRITENLLFNLITLQIVFSILKFLIIGVTESIVGTLSARGGAMATSLPILGFMFIWLKKGGRFNRWDWVYIVGLLFIGFVSIKRAIWFIMPVILTLFFYYIPKRKIPTSVAILGTALIPLIFYLGVRLNPTLNKENERWGSFDFEYTIDYAQNYMFGEEDRNNEDIAYGRGGATTVLFQNLFRGKVKDEEWLGSGLRLMYATDYTEFSELDFGLNHKGSATGVYQTMISNGYIGVLATLLLIVAFVSYIKNNRIRIVLLLFILWEYLFYTGIIIREPGLMVIFVYLIIFSNRSIAHYNNVINPKRRRLILFT